MAIRSASNVVRPVVTGTPPPQFKGVCTIRIAAQKFGPSAAGLPMITLDCEIVKPDKVKSDLDGAEYDLTGQKLNYYLMLNETSLKGEPSQNLYKFMNETLPMFGLPSEFDDANPLASLKFTGLCFEAIISTRLRKEQRKNPDGSYSPLTDAQGKEIVRGWEWSNQSSDILRKAETVEGRPF